LLVCVLSCLIYNKMMMMMMMMMVPYMFVFVNRQYNEAHAHIAIWALASTFR